MKPPPFEPEDTFVAEIAGFTIYLRGHGYGYGYYYTPGSPGVRDARIVLFRNGQAPQPDADRPEEVITYCQAHHALNS